MNKPCIGCGCLPTGTIFLRCPTETCRYSDPSVKPETWNATIHTNRLRAEDIPTAEEWEDTREAFRNIAELGDPPAQRLARGFLSLIGQPKSTTKEERKS